MVIRSANSEQTWDRQPWGSGNLEIQAWVNDLVWKTLTGSSEGLEAPSTRNLPSEGLDNCREVFIHNRLEGLVPRVWGEKLRGAVGDEFYKRIETARRRTELFAQEVHWILGPALGAEVVLVDDFAMRPQYATLKGQGGNPRPIFGLSLWAPTLSTREELVRTLAEGGFDPDPSGPAGYIYCKETDGVFHQIMLLGTIWETTRNWTLDLEREIWDRARRFSTGIPIKPELTDLFIFTARRFAVDTLCGNGLLLHDLAMLAERSGEFDWDRVRQIKNAFHKPDWLWAALVGLVTFEARTGKRFEFPEWVREGIKTTDSFWHHFVESRLNWSSPDLRLVDFPRAHVKAARGT